MRWGRITVPTFSAALLVSVSGCGDHAAWVRIPAGEAWLGSVETRETHPPRRAVFPAFQLGRAPVTVAEYVIYLNERRTEALPPSDPAIRDAGNRWTYIPGMGGRPVTGITRAEAEEYCRWLSEKMGIRARLPSADEWEYAARGGVDGARYPWGWGAPRRVETKNGPLPVERSSRHPYGLSDLVGNVFQWCSDNDRNGMAIACGGSWSERDPRFLRVFQRTPFPGDYRGRDVGFRVLIELKED